MILLLLILRLGSGIGGQLYTDGLEILKHKLSTDNYSADLRPLRNQSMVMHVEVAFSLVSIVEVNEVTQSFVCNGFLSLVWTDELLAWTPEDYGNITLIHPMPESIWRPRVLLFNTIDKRDIFTDDQAPSSVDYTGSTHWVPGSLFLTSCQMNMTKYPFDEHKCSIELSAMTFQNHELLFDAPSSPEVNLKFFTAHGEWEVLDTHIETFYFTAGYVPFSSIKVSITIQRRPLFLLINTVLPVIFLSFLNILVFLIPANSGEKISYGITVLLALSLFLSIVGGMLPRSSKSMPKVTLYLFLLLATSMLTVIDSIVIVYLHHMVEKEMIHQKAKLNFTAALRKVTNLRYAVDSLSDRVSKATPSAKMVSLAAKLKKRPEGNVERAAREKGDHNDNDVTCEARKSYPEFNKYKMIGKYNDSASFIVFLVIWLGLTVGFMLDIASAYISVKS